MEEITLKRLIVLGCPFSPKPLAPDFEYPTNLGSQGPSKSNNPLSFADDAMEIIPRKTFLECHPVETVGLQITQKIYAWLPPNVEIAGDHTAQTAVDA